MRVITTFLTKYIWPKWNIWAHCLPPEISDIHIYLMYFLYPSNLYYSYIRKAKPIKMITFLTSNSISAQQLPIRHGVLIFSTSSLFSFWRVNVGTYGWQIWVTYPTGTPGGARIFIYKSKRTYINYNDNKV